MQAEEKKYSVKKLVEAFSGGSLDRNAEYQRGESWSDLQKAGFIDSIFRSYPVPVIYLHKIHTANLDGNDTYRLEIVDGQQRLTALRDFVQAKFRLEPVGEESRLRLPKSVQVMPAPWAGKLIGELREDLLERFEQTEINVFIIGPDSPPDEIRDLFIRLQSGTALTRQQVRDAWPGNIGPFVQKLAGKLD